MERLQQQPTDASYGNYVVIEDKQWLLHQVCTHGYTKCQCRTDCYTRNNHRNNRKYGSSTGSHLHIECLYNGEYYNPLFYFDVGEGTLYGESPVVAVRREMSYHLIPMMMQQYRHLWRKQQDILVIRMYGAVLLPSTSFDCSGFVCWVFTNSGVHQSA